MSAEPPVTVRCPDWPNPGVAPADDVIGCGALFTEVPDDEGLVDCPHCGIWFPAADHLR